MSVGDRAEDSVEASADSLACVNDDILVSDVLVSVGTDHHPFDRLVAWMDQWQSEHLNAPVCGTGGVCRVNVQYGTSTRPSTASGESLMTHSALQAAMANATAIVTHGGPATIRDARSAGLRPLVVPRDPAFGEHVDDHQIRFTRMLAERGDIVLCREKDQLFEALDQAMESNAWLRLEVGAGAVEITEAIERVASILDEVIESRRRGRSRPWPWRRL